jgi:hypothetical protein
MTSEKEKREGETARKKRRTEREIEMLESYIRNVNGDVSSPSG